MLGKVSLVLRRFFKRDSLTGRGGGCEMGPGDPQEGHARSSDHLGGKFRYFIVFNEHFS